MHDTCGIRKRASPKPPLQNKNLSMSIPIIRRLSVNKNKDDDDDAPACRKNDDDDDSGKVVCLRGFHVDSFVRMVLLVPAVGNNSGQFLTKVPFCKLHESGFTITTFFFCEKRAATWLGWARAGFSL